jgi:hypothetical protein
MLRIEHYLNTLSPTCIGCRHPLPPEPSQIGTGKQRREGCLLPAFHPAQQEGRQAPGQQGGNGDTPPPTSAKGGKAQEAAQGHQSANLGHVFQRNVGLGCAEEDPSDAHGQGATDSRDSLRACGAVGREERLSSATRRGHRLEHMLAMMEAKMVAQLRRELAR